MKRRTFEGDQSDVWRNGAHSTSLWVLVLIPCISTLSATLGGVTGASLVTGWNLRSEDLILVLMMGAIIGVVATLPVFATGFVILRLMTRTERVTYLLTTALIVGVLTGIMHLFLASYMAAV